MQFHIVKCQKMFTHDERLCIVMDFADGGDLYDLIATQRRHIRQRGSGYFPERSIVSWFIQLCCGLKHCHDNKLLHRDIKSKNVLLFQNSRFPGGFLLKLGDFGLAKAVRTDEGNMARTACGTPLNMSPELMQNLRYSFETDVWALGTVLHEICALESPFIASNMKDLRRAVIRTAPRDIPSSYSRTMKSLIHAMLHKKPERRPSVDDVLALPHIKAALAENLDAQRAVPVGRHRSSRAPQQPAAHGHARTAWAPAPVKAAAPAPAPAPKPTAKKHRARPFEYWSPPENAGAPRPRKSVVDRHNRKKAEEYSKQVRDDERRQREEQLARRAAKQAQAAADAIKAEQLAKQRVKEAAQREAEAAEAAARLRKQVERAYQLERRGRERQQRDAAREDAPPVAAPVDVAAQPPEKIPIRLSAAPKPGAEDRSLSKMASDDRASAPPACQKAGKFECLVGSVEMHGGQQRGGVRAEVNRRFDAAADAPPPAQDIEAAGSARKGRPSGVPPPPAAADADAEAAPEPKELSSSGSETEETDDDDDEDFEDAQAVKFMDSIHHVLTEQKRQAEQQEAAAGGGAEDEAGAPVKARRGCGWRETEKTAQEELDAKARASQAEGSSAREQLVAELGYERFCGALFMLLESRKHTNTKTVNQIISRCVNNVLDGDVRRRLLLETVVECKAYSDGQAEPSGAKGGGGAPAPGAEPVGAPAVGRDHRVALESALQAAVAGVGGARRER